MELIKSISGIIAAVVIPIVIVVVGNAFTKAIREREIQGRLVELAIGPIGPDVVLVISDAERRSQAEVGEGRIGEVAQHRSCRRRLHGEVVVRAGPAAMLFLVARRTCGAASVGGAGRCGLLTARPEQQ